MSPDQPMTTVVEYQIRPENTTMAQWLTTWEKRGQDAQTGEPETTAYAAAISLQNELNLLVFERYSKGNASLGLHMQRPSHKALTDEMGERRMTKRRVMSSQFTDVADFGWWGRPAATDHDIAAGVILILSGLRFETPAQSEQFLELSAGHATYCWENEPGTLIYSGGIARADADRELDIKQGDLIFVMAYTDMASVETHRDDPNHLALEAEMVKRAITPENTFTRMYRTTGKGFLWRKTRSSQPAGSS